MERPVPLSPLPYHLQLLDYLQSQEVELWNLFSSNRVRKEHADAVRLELLKTTYRIERETEPRLHGLAHEASLRLGLDGPITFYQAQSSLGLNASLALLPEETHIVLHGPIIEVLQDGELTALIGHELAHRLLWTQWDGRFLVVDQILAAMTNDASAEAPWRESSRLFGLYTEVFCDRGSLTASGGDLSSSVAALVKTETGLKSVSAESYLKQAEEIFSHDAARVSAANLTHPESFIRARSLRLWQELGPAAEEEIRSMIEGPLVLSELDLLGQAKVSKETRRLLDELLAPRWMQTETTLGHARLFFEDYQPAGEPAPGDSLAADLERADDSLKDYFCYVLLDFATADRDLDDVPLAAACLLSERLGLAERFEPIVRKELQMRKKQLEKLRRDAGAIVARADQVSGVP